MSVSSTPGGSRARSASGTCSGGTSTKPSARVVEVTGDRRDDLVLVFPSIARFNLAEDADVHQRYRENPPDVYGFGHIAYLQHVMNAVRAGTPALVDGLVAWVIDAAESTGLTTVALCGGCLLNRHLRNALPSRLQTRGLEVLQPRCMPPNDGAISLGQAWVAQRAD